MNVKLKSGDKATVYHEGTKSYYDATIIRPVSKQEMIAVLKASSGEDPRPDTTIFRQVLKDQHLEALANRKIYNDINADKTTRRLKVYGHSGLTTKNLPQLHKAMERQFGDRLLETGLTDRPPMRLYAASHRRELYIRLKAF